MKKQAYWQVGDIIGMIQNDNNKEEEMKTEPTEAYIIAKRLFDYEDEPILESDICEIADIAFQEGQSNPKIKRLEWEERKYCYIARTAFGFYRIFDASPLEKKQSCVLYFGETAQKVSVGTYEECIKNAQIDFENRVKKCLITE